jgi:peptidyl-prolyl cis-trans isomerase B (cyclophilin B)
MRTPSWGLALAAAFIVAVPVAVAAQARRTPARPGFFTTTLTPDQMKNKQAVVETSTGTFVIELLPDAAPNHVGYFMKLAADGAYAGTTFHRAIKLGLVQGGDPVTRDPAKRSLYGTGGLGVLKAEKNDLQHVRGAVSAVLRPNEPDSAGAQFFICISDQPGLNGQFTVFGRVVEGLEVPQQVSTMPTDASGLLTDRVVINKVSIRDAPPPEPTPFEADSVQSLAKWRAVLETTLGEVTLEFFPDRAPGHVRNFLRLAQLGVYDGTPVHRIVPGFVIQTGGLNGRREPLSEKQQKFVGNVAPEFNPTRHELGIVSMARGDAPDSAQTSFFICTGPAPSLDEKYTVFGRVVDGLAVVQAIEKVERNGEEPVQRVEIVKVRLVPAVAGSPVGGGQPASPPPANPQAVNQNP